MKRDAAIAKLRENEAAIRALGATSLYLYGSTARDEAGPDSDIDVFVEYTPGTGFSLLELSGLKILLEDQFRRKVDVTTRNSLNRFMRKGIEEDAVRVF